MLGHPNSRRHRHTGPDKHAHANGDSPADPDGDRATDADPHTDSRRDAVFPNALRRLHARSGHADAHTLRCMHAHADTDTNAHVLCRLHTRPRDTDANVPAVR